MNELIQRIGMSGANTNSLGDLEQYISCYYHTVACVRYQKSKTSAAPNNYETPFTKEIMIFFIAVFFYNAFDIVISLITGIPGNFSVAVHYVTVIGYFAVGAFKTLLFLQVIKKYVAQVNGMEGLRKTAFFIQLLHIPALALLAITPFTHHIKTSYYSMYKPTTLFCVVGIFAF